MPHYSYRVLLAPILAPSIHVSIYCPFCRVPLERRPVNVLFQHHVIHIMSFNIMVSTASTWRLLTDLAVEARPTGPQAYDLFDEGQSYPSKRTYSEDIQ